VALERFYIEQPPDGAVARLSREESHHLRRVRRVKVGDQIVLFDGTGTDYTGRVKRWDKAGVTVEITGRQCNPREPGVDVTLAVSLVKQSPMHQLLDTCTQLGMARLIPMRTERTVVKMQRARPERWRRIAIEACKQCGRSVIPEIGPLLDFEDVLHKAGDYDLAVVGSTERGSRPLVQVLGRSVGSVLCLVGPEGGLSDKERAAAADAGCVCVSLSANVLRTETAAAAALAAIVQLTAG